jgi:hypothetical protein
VFHSQAAERMKPDNAGASSGLLDFLVACDHSAADMAAGGCCRAATECVIPLHSRATCLTDLGDHVVCLMKRRGRHCLGGACEGQSKRNSDEPNYCFLHVYPVVERGRPTATRGWTPQRVWRARRRERRQTATSARRGTTDVGCGRSYKLMGSPSKNWSTLLTPPIIRRRYPETPSPLSWRHSRFDTQGEKHGSSSTTPYHCHRAGKP